MRGPVALGVAASLIIATLVASSAPALAALPPDSGQSEPVVPNDAIATVSSTVAWGPCGLSGTPASTVYLPNVTKTLGGPAGWVTPFYVQNVGVSIADVVVSFYRFSDGGLVTCRTVRGISPGEVVDDNPNEDPDLPDNTQFSVVVQSFGAEVTAVVNQLQGSGASTQALSYSGFTTGATTVYLPNVTRRFYGYDVPFIVQNMGAANAAVTASFVSFDATQRHTTTLSIAPGRSGVIDPDYTPGLVDGTQYAVTLASTQPIGVVVNAHNEALGPVAFSHNGLSSGGTTLWAPYAMKAGPGGIFSPIVVQNVGTAAVTATLAFTPLTGGPTQSFALASIPAGGSRPFDPRFTLGTITPCATASATCLGNGEYSLKITAPTAVAAVVLPNSASTAAAYLANAAPKPSNYMPLVLRNIGGASGWNGTVYVQSATATSATLRYYTMPGYRLAATQFVTLTAGTAKRLDPRTVTGLVDEGAYAVIADSGSGDLSSIVFEQAGTGGDAAMIYEAAARPAAPGPYIRGNVSGPSGAVAGVQVSALAGGWYINSAVTDQNGQYQLPVPVGTFEVRFDPPMAARLTPQYYAGAASSSESTPVSVSAGSDRTGVSATLQAALFITGRVTGRVPGGGPIPGATVFAHRTACPSCVSMYGAVTDADGYYRLAVPAGTYRVHFNPPEGEAYQDIWWGVTPSFSTSYDIVVSGDVGNINATLSWLLRITGTVRDGTGRGIPGVTVRARLGGTAACCTTADVAITDAYGRYMLAVENGTYKVSFIPPGYSGYAVAWYGGAPSFQTAADITVGAGDRTGIDATLARGAMMGGFARYQGVPSYGIAVQVYLGGGSTCCNNLVWTGTSDIHGQWWAGVAPGTYRVRFVALTSSGIVEKWYMNATSFATANDIFAVTGLVSVHGDLP